MAGLLPNSSAFALASVLFAISYTNVSGPTPCRCCAGMGNTQVKAAKAFLWRIEHISWLFDKMHLPKESLWIHAAQKNICF
jgi:hypothetical protein